MGWGKLTGFVLLWHIATATVIDLSTLNWTLKNQNGSIVIPAYIPSQVHLDLLKAGVIDEPLLGTNEATERWIINDNWTYTANLLPISHLISGSNPLEQNTVLLTFYGLDTVANITIAGHDLAWTNNQFEQYVYDISNITSSLSESQTKNTNLTVYFESAWFYGQNVTSRSDAEWIIGDNFEYPGVRAWIRKIADDFGWDWGPAFVPSGIFKPASITILNKANVSTTEIPVNPSSTATPVYIQETSVDIYKRGQNFSTAPVQTADWIVNVTLLVQSATAWDSPYLTLSFPELNQTKNFTVPKIPADVSSPTTISVQWTLPDGVAERWYPYNLGTPKLYNLTVGLELAPSTTVESTLRTGFRTIYLAQTAYSQAEIEERGITPGDQWHFEINGKAFYAKGTNVIPFDPFYSRINNDKVRWVLESAKNSGQNMLRIWGGGIYQPSDTKTAGGLYDFYSAADELGILLWSELIFSDSLYPINDWYLASIEPEVRQNVRRINRHPSNVQWAGGNEIEGIVMSVNTSLANGTHYLNEFVTLFQDFLYEIVTSETHSVAYTDCSTTHGVLSLDPYILRFANGTPGYIYGNSERYNYDASQAFNLSTYPVARFVNEFGYHSMPSFYTWEEVLQSPEDFSFNSTVVMSRDHHPPAGNLSFPNPNAPQGQYQMSSAVELWLPTPSTTDSNQTFAQWCYSTQIFQSMTMVAQIAWYRRGAGLGENNLGSLVWQLNDIWQGVSWSSIEYSGRWKVLNYGMASIYAPVVINPLWYANNETLEILVTSDQLEPVSGTTTLTWYNWEGQELASSSHKFTTPALNNTQIFKQSGLTSILPHGVNEKDAWLLLNLTASLAGGQSVTNEQYFTPTSLASAALVDPKIHVAHGNNMTFTLSAHGGVAAWTWLDHPYGTVGYFADVKTGYPTNGFYLVPGIDRAVQFILDDATSSVKNPNPADFVVRSIWNNTHV